MCPMIRSSKSVSRNPLINVVKPRPRSTPTHLRSARPLCRSPWFAQDAALERTGFEPPVPLLQRALLLAGHPGRRHENRNQLRSGPRPRWLPSGPFHSRFVLGGTTSSNSSSSSGESANSRSPSICWPRVGTREALPAAVLGICVSRVVRDQVRDRLDYPFEGFVTATPSSTH
jgi:hypothetical protein